MLYIGLAIVGAILWGVGGAIGLPLALGIVHLILKGIANG